MTNARYSWSDIPPAVLRDTSARFVVWHSERMEYHVIDRTERRIIGPWGVSRGANDYANGMNAKEKH